MPWTPQKNSLFLVKRHIGNSHSTLLPALHIIKPPDHALERGVGREPSLTIALRPKPRLQRLALVAHALDEPGIALGAHHDRIHHDLAREGAAQRVDEGGVHFFWK
jgi:hypothetical protein